MADSDYINIELLDQQNDVAVLQPTQEGTGSLAESTVHKESGIGAVFVIAVVVLVSLGAVAAVLWLSLIEVSHSSYFYISDSVLKLLNITLIFFIEWSLLSSKGG